MADGIDLAMKSPEEQMNLDVYKSYSLIYSPEIEQEIFREYLAIDKVLDMFIWASGQRFLPALTMSKFSKIAKVFKGIGTKPVSKFDVDVCYKKMVNFHEQMDFYAFLDSIDFLLRRAFMKSELKESEKMKVLMDNFEIVKTEKKVVKKSKPRGAFNGLGMIGEIYGVKKKGGKRKTKRGKSIKKGPKK